MKNSNRFIGRLAVTALVSGMLFCGFSGKAAGETKKKGKTCGTYVINTLESGKSVKGFAGPVPIEMTVSNGKITAVRPLKNNESPGYFKLVTDSGLLDKFVGLTPKKAAELKVDAVSGATYSSTAIIENIRIAAREAAGK